MSQARTRIAIPRTVWALGLVSLCMDLSSEMIHALLPVFLVSGMGMSMAAFGLMEGMAEATALIVKVFSGAISDYIGRRKGLILFGYGLAALTKPLFPLAATPALAVTARLLDRLGKGIRGAPRDALVADVAPPEIRGACFGLRQSMDTVGAFIGPLLAILLMWLFADHIASVLWFAVIPAFLAVALIVFGIEEPDAPPRSGRMFRSPLSRQALRQFPAHYWAVVAVAGVLTLARFSEGFLVLRAQQAGLPLVWLPGAMVVMSLVYSLSAYPVGVLSDRLGGRALLALGLLVLILADLVLAWLPSIPGVLLGVSLWGLHMGLTQGILAAQVAQSAPPELRGTAFGVFNLVSGLCMVVSSALAGWLWQAHGAASAFLFGAAFSALALAGGALALRRGA